MLSSTKQKGKITQWDDEKGYGFIEPCLQGPRLFLHISDFNNKQRRPGVGDLVVYQTIQRWDGKLRASRVKFSAADIAAPKATTGNSRLSILLCLGFVLVLTIVIWQQRLPQQLGYLYLALSVLTFLLYWQDKAAARRGLRRTRESTLLLFGLLGGWPGAVLAQQTLRHKSVKTEFRVKFWLSVSLNVSGLLLWYDQNFTGLPVSF